MKNPYYISLFLGLLLISVSCSSPTDKPYSEETSKEDLALIGETLDSNTIRYLMVGMIKYTFQNSFPDGITYQDLIDEGEIIAKEQAIEKKKQDELAEQLRIEEEARLSRLRDVLTVALVKKEYVEYNYQDYINISFGFKNNSDKEIRAFKGGIVFADLFDETIKESSITYDEPIPANSSIVWNASLDYNQFSSEDKLLRNKDLDDIKLVWKPEKFMFTDGTSLE
jgi:hypothetical protein